MPRRPSHTDDDLDLGFDEGDIDALGLDEDELLSAQDADDAHNLAADIDDRDSRRHGEGVLVHNGRKYAVGLTWLTTNEETETKAVYKRAQSIGADFFCVRSLIAQHGFGYLSMGHRMGMASAAAMAADVLVGEWHAVFSAENGWHYVAVHADTIAPDGDRFFESEEEAYNHFQSRAANYNWPKTYAPEAWNIKNSDGEIPLDRILDDVASTSLRPANLDGVFSGKRNKSIALVGLVFFVGLVLLSFFAQRLLPSVVPEQRTIAGPIVEVADILSVPPREPVQKQDPLMMAIENFSLPRPSMVVGACMEGFSDLSVSLPGWNLTTMRCRNSIVEAVWQQQGGTLETIKPYVDQFPFGVNRTYGAQGDFLASRVIGNISEFAEKVNLADREQILLAVNNRFGSLGRLEVRDVVPMAQQVRRGENVRGSRRLAAQNQPEDDRQITIQDLPSLAVVFNSEAAPLLLQDYFNIPGLRFNFIEWNVYNRRWIYDMQIYLLPQDAPSRNRLAQ